MKRDRAALGLQEAAGDGTVRKRSACRPLAERRGWVDLAERTCRRDNPVGQLSQVSPSAPRAGHGGCPLFGVDVVTIRAEYPALPETALAVRAAIGDASAAEQCEQGGFLAAAEAGDGLAVRDLAAGEGTVGLRGADPG